MFCLRCGAKMGDSIYCPKCGLDNSVQKQAVVLSGLYYNAGLEKAQIRDLSGAAEELQRALKFNKNNIDARNLLGLVWFEQGEVVAALSEWVISKNLKEENNLASYFIADLQKDAVRLDVINQTIKKFNISLKNAREGNEDVAIIQLKKVLAQNPKLIKGYHLLALLYLKQEDYERARKLLRRALKVDQTNTTTLRLLKEVDDKTGKATAVEARLPFFSKRTLADENTAPPGGERHGFLKPQMKRMSVLWLVAGILIGAAVIGFLFIPSSVRKVSNEANEKITTYSSETAQLRSELRAAQDDKETAVTAKENAEAVARAKTREAVSHANMITAWDAYGLEEYERCANAMAAVDPSVLSEDARAVYDMIAPDVRSLLLEKLKDRGVAALNSSDYETAVAAFGAAVLLDDADEQIKSYLVEAQQRLATQNAELRIQNTAPAGVQVIPSQPETQNGTQAAPAADGAQGTPGTNAADGAQSGASNAASSGAQSTEPAAEEGAAQEEGSSESYYEEGEEETWYDDGTYDEEYYYDETYNDETYDEENWDDEA